MRIGFSLRQKVFVWSFVGFCALQAMQMSLDHAGLLHSPLGRTAFVVLGAQVFALLLSRRSAVWMSRLGEEPVIREHTQALLARLSPESVPRSRGAPLDLVRALDRATEELTSSLARLQSERDQLEAILETMMEGVLVTDQSGRIVHANRALRNMVLATGPIAGKAPIEVIRNRELAELVTRVLRDGEASGAEIELGGLEPRRIRVRAAPLRPPSVQGLVAILYDVTDLRRLETMRRDFVANVSHELRTPIAAIRAAVETLESGALEDQIASAEFVGMIARHAARLHELVEDLLDLSRLDARSVELDLIPTSVCEVFEGMVALYGLAANRRSIQLTYQLGDYDPWVIADRRALDRIFSNLIDNAIKYSQSGSSVVMGAEPAANEAFVRLLVRDTGPGIETRHLPRIFERFYRADRGRGRDRGGTGLGLAIVKHLAEALGGTASLTSEVSKGSTFYIELPVANIPATESAAQTGIVV